MATEDIRLDGQGDLRDEPEGLLEQEHPAEAADSTGSY